MVKIELSLPQIGLIAATRGMLGAGIGLLVGDRLTPEQRRAAGWTLLGVGLLTTVPLVVEVISHRVPSGDSRPSRRSRHEEPAGALP